MPEPVALDDIKRHLALDTDDTSEDDYLNSMIAAARRSCELRTRRTIIGEERSLVLPCFPGSGATYTASAALLPAGSGDIALSGGSVSAVTVRYYDGDGEDVLLDAATYFEALEAAPPVLRPRAEWPSAQDRPDAVRISYTASPLISADLDMAKHAIRLIVAHWYQHREAVASDGEGRPPELPLSVTWLLNPLTKFSVA